MACKPKNMAFDPPPPLLCHMNRFYWGWLERAEYCFERNVSEERTHRVLRSTAKKNSVSLIWHTNNRLRGTHWVLLVRVKKLTEFGVWNRTLRNRIRPVSEIGWSSIGCVFLLTVEVFLLTVRLFYLRWGNRKQRRPNPISGRGEP